MSDAGAPPLLLSCDAGVAHIRFNRPASLNAIDEESAQVFLAACRTIESTEGIRAVVLSGEGKAFMAGGDLARFRAEPQNADRIAEAMIRPLHEGLRVLARLPAPVIGSLHGAVAGAGFSLACFCDLAIAAERTRFSPAYSRIAATADGSYSWSLPRIVGLRKAMEISLLAETFDAAEALRLGLVNHVVPDDRLAAETTALARRLADGPTFAYGRIKNLLRASLDHDLETQLDQERDAFCAAARTADFAEGIRAFFEKTPPRFTGR
ncbi:MAG TPA: enoyl-CoA hydratase-related protein [Stellaceae bacterium]|nr:enoyl-CoA hydratase-related protein [Stellaceae bacterium]